MAVKRADRQKTKIDRQSDRQRETADRQIRDKNRQAGRQTDRHRKTDAVVLFLTLSSLFLYLQLLISIAFNQPVKLHSLKLQGPEDGEFFVPHQ